MDYSLKEFVSFWADPVDVKEGVLSENGCFSDTGTRLDTLYQLYIEAPLIVKDQEKASEEERAPGGYTDENFSRRFNKARILLERALDRRAIGDEVAYVHQELPLLLDRFAVFYAHKAKILKKLWGQAEIKALREHSRLLSAIEKKDPLRLFDYFEEQAYKLSGLAKPETETRKPLDEISRQRMAKKLVTAIAAGKLIELGASQKILALRDEAEALDKDVGIFRDLDRTCRLFSKAITETFCTPARQKPFSAPEPRRGQLILFPHRGPKILAVR